MGAQQVKPLDESSTLHTDQQRYLRSKRISNEIITQQAGVKAVMFNQSMASIPNPKQSLVVANFAKIKVEPCPSDEPDTPGDEVKMQHQDTIFDKSAEIPETRGISLVDIQENFTENGNITQLSIEIKEEILESSAETFKQNDVSLPAHGNSLECRSMIKSEVADECEVVESLENKAVIDKNSSESINFLTEPESVGNVIESTNSPKLVKNPFAVLKKNCAVRNEFQQIFFNNDIKSEAKPIDEDLELDTKYNNQSDINVTANFNEIITKSEEFDVSESNEESIDNANLYQTCLSYNLNSSLDVNLSHEDTDLDETSSTKRVENINTNSTLNKKPPYFKHHSTRNSQLKQNINKPQKNINYKECKIGKKRNLQIKKQKNRQKVKRLVKPKTKKYTTKKQNKIDLSFKFNTKKLLKNLPKTAVKTRQRTNKSIDKKNADSKCKAEFPKPFKLEPEDQSVAVELPKPIMFKSEFAFKSKNKQTYLRAEFQPLVRLRRLKSEELLVPLNTRHVRRVRTFRGTNETRRDFLIQQAYSLNPYSKLNRFSMDSDNLYSHDQRLSHRRFTGSCSNFTDVANETNYLSAREQTTFFQASTPDGTSMFSGPIDSGISTSTPNTLQHYQQIPNNNTLLLRIAAERAFINNHLMHFGYSPIQFDLYNKLNELNIFLKFLFGN